MERTEQNKPYEAIDISVLDSGIENIENFQNCGHYFAIDSNGLKKVSTSQLRKFFGALKQIQADFDTLNGEIILLDAKLAYAVGRDIKNGKQQSKIKEFYTLLSQLIRNINKDKKKFKHFVDVFEAIVAYHKEIEDVKNPK